MKHRNTFLAAVFSVIVVIGSIPRINSGRGVDEAAAQTEETPLYFTTMTHMEGGHTDDRDEDVFWRHVEQLRYGITLASEFNAKLTIESEKPFARANVLWEHNMLQEILDSGHGVGTHCDIGFRDPLIPVEEFALQFAENKTLVDGLVGAENNRGCSGGGSMNDYVLAASMAGFEYLDGIVSMHFLSMPLENRPDETWTNDYIYNGGHHENAPLDIHERIYPFAVKDATDFVADEDSVLLISAGDLGRLDRMGDEGYVQENCRIDCGFTNEQVEYLVETLREIDSFRDRSQIAKVSIYIPVDQFDEQFEDEWRYFFSEMQALQDEGVITWATQGEVYDAYLAWNGLESFGNTGIEFSPSDTTIEDGHPCGNTICEGPENAENCPLDCANTSSLPSNNPPALSPIGDVYSVVNPTSQAALYVEVIHPSNWANETLPTLVLIPGGTGDSSSFRRGSRQSATTLADLGYVVVIFDPDGRGQSEGTEDHGGYIQQDGLKATIQFAATLPEVDAEKIGLISFSYGATMASGTLARYPELPVQFLIDWEGPADRTDTGGCGEDIRGKLNPTIECDDEDYWQEREALTFISQINVPYQRLQTQQDHVQADNDHALKMINAAINGNSTWVRLNELGVNQVYDLLNPPVMLNEGEWDGRLMELAATVIPTLFDL